MKICKFCLAAIFRRRALLRNTDYILDLLFQIAESAHPYEEHPLSLEEKLCHEAEYYLHVLLKQREEERDDFFQDEPSVSMGGDPSGPDTTANIRQPESDTCVLIGLEGLLTFPRIKNLCSSVDEIRLKSSH